MVYSKIDWTEEIPITAARLNTVETQYDEFKTVYDAHDHDDNYYTETECDARFFDAGTDGPGSGMDADTVDGYTAAQIIAAGVPSGGIAVWGRSIVSIPPGWQLCNGTNGTLDLRDKFLVGAGSSYAKGATGGYADRTPSGSVTIGNHTLTASEIPQHIHVYNDIWGSGTVACNYTGYSRNRYDPQDHLRTSDPVGGGAAHGHTGSSFSGSSYDNRPPYYALAFIQKVAS